MIFKSSFSVLDFFRVSFTAITDCFGEGSNKRHKLYVQALKHYGIKVIQGYFKKSKDYRRLKDLRTKVELELIELEEKQADVNIASYLIEGSFTKDNALQYDVAFVMSGDSDLIPAIQTVKRNFLEKIVGFVIPPFEGNNTQSNPVRIQNVDGLREASDFQRNLKFAYLQNHLLSEEIKDSEGNIILQRPLEYK